MSDVALSLRGVVRRYEQAGASLDVLNGVSFELKRGELVGLIGPSGAGKSTLLHTAGILERPDAGEVWVGGRPMHQLGDDERSRMRRESVGYVYQFHHLLPEFSALENIVIPQMIAGKSRREATTRAQILLAKVGLSNREGHRPAKLSGGEQQRVAIARALANSPTLLLADEPTGNLDPLTAEFVFAMLVALVRDTGLAALVATHNLELASRMDRVLKMENGQVVPA